MLTLLLVAFRCFLLAAVGLLEPPSAARSRRTISPHPVQMKRNVRVFPLPGLRSGLGALCREPTLYRDHLRETTGELATYCILPSPLIARDLKLCSFYGQALYAMDERPHFSEVHGQCRAIDGDRA